VRTPVLDKQPKLTMSSETVPVCSAEVIPFKDAADVLYRFACNVQSRNQRCSEEVGWELLRALTSSDPTTRLVAEALVSDL